MRREHGLVDISLRAMFEVLFPVNLDFRVKFGDLTLLLFISGKDAAREMVRR